MRPVLSPASAVCYIGKTPFPSHASSLSRRMGIVSTVEIKQIMTLLPKWPFPRASTPRRYSKQTPGTTSPPKLIKLVIGDPTGSNRTNISRVVGIRSKVDGRTMSRRTSRVFVVARIPASDHGASGASEAGARHVCPRVAAIRNGLVAVRAAVLGVLGGSVVGGLPAAVVGRALDSHERHRGQEVGRVGALARNRRL